MFNNKNYEKIKVGIKPYVETYELNRKRFLIHFKNKSRFSKKITHNFLEYNKLKPLLSEISMPYYDVPLENMNPLLVETHEVLNNFEDVDKFSITLQENYNSNIHLVTPIYFKNKIESNMVSPIINTIIIRLKDSPNSKEIAKICKKYGLKLNKQFSKYLYPYYLFKVTSRELLGKGVSPYFELINMISKEHSIMGIDFDWMDATGGFLDATPNDIYYDKQWNLFRINAAPSMIRGNRGDCISIAVIDSGFDCTVGGIPYDTNDDHKDISFTSNVSPHYTHFNALELDMGRIPPYNADQSTYPHGTATAGVCGAITNNNRGIAGLNISCQIMPIKIGTEVVSTRVAAGLNWATEHGAKVVNMSFKCVPVDCVISAIENAWNSGIVLCAAAGNMDRIQTSSAVEFPARHNLVIAVGASDTEDQRKQARETHDEKECWESCYGNELDVIAPGVLIWTVDEREGFGFNRADGSRKIYDRWCIDYPYLEYGDVHGYYFSKFSGTSASSPHIAGLAGMLFSINPSLTNQQVRDIIESTCDKVHPEIYDYQNYPDRPNGTWNEQVGYGRINCEAALNRVLSL